MTIRSAQAHWEGTLKNGAGNMELGSGTFKGLYSFQSRFKNDDDTNPEELIAAAHAGCFTMAFSMLLEQAGYPPTSIHTQTELQLKETDKGFRINNILLITKAAVPGIEEEEFLKQAETAKDDCPVSKALAGTRIHLKAYLKR
jgi:osmotically inducible protein OsmC